jgi:hypothetical protein
MVSPSEIIALSFCGWRVDPRAIAARQQGRYHAGGDAHGDRHQQQFRISRDLLRSLRNSVDLAQIGPDKARHGPCDQQSDADSRRRSCQSDH